MTDIDITTKPSRPWATLHANNLTGQDWIRRHVPRAESSVAATVPAIFIEEYVAAIERHGLGVEVYRMENPIRAVSPTDRAEPPRRMNRARPQCAGADPTSFGASLHGEGP